MKKIILQITLIIAFSTIVFAQAKSKGLPEGIAAAFSGKYDNIPVSSWKVKAGNYIIKFKKDNRTHYAVYSDGGLWLQTETSYGLTHSLPTDVQNGWKGSDYKAWEVEAIKNIESAEGNYYVIRATNVRNYEAAGMLEKLTYDLYFSASGELVKKIDRPWGSPNL